MIIEYKNLYDNIIQFIKKIDRNIGITIQNMFTNEFSAFEIYFNCLLNKKMQLKLLSFLNNNFKHIIFDIEKISSNNTIMVIYLKNTNIIRTNKVNKLLDKISIL